MDIVNKNKLLATKVRRHCRAFARQEDGSMVLFSVLILIMTMLSMGMAVDFMRIESTRARVQGTVDRAVLAAADLDQAQEPKSVVYDYLDKAGLADSLVGEPKLEEGLNYRIVSAEAEVEVPMIFSGVAKMVDEDARNAMLVPAVSSAQEKVSKVEISLVLDISGSMSDNNRIQNMRTAARDFVNTVLADGNEDLISVSLVPYSEQVSLSHELFDALNVDVTHDYNSRCIEFEAADFATTSISPTRNYEQTQHFQWVLNQYNNMDYPVCATRDWTRVVPWSQNRADLLSRINQLQPYSQTSIYLGMKWGVGLLDPSMQPVLNTLVSKGKVNGTLAGRPVAHNDTETLKFVVLMTDGQNTTSYRIQDWAYQYENYRAHWARYNLQWYLNRYVYSYRHDQYRYAISGDYGDAMLEDICAAARDQGIIIWTVGFETNSHGANTMQNCASSPSHYFDVEGLEISQAFRAIATQINNLKLTK